MNGPDPDEAIEAAREARERSRERARQLEQDDNHVVARHLRRLTENAGRIDTLTLMLRSAEHDLAEAQAAQQNAYSERNRLVAALSKMFPSHLVPSEDGDPEWSIVCVHLPTGHASWHVRRIEMMAGWFTHVGGQPQVQPHGWDGHTTEEKYLRLEALTPPGPTTTRNISGDELVAELQRRLDLLKVGGDIGGTVRTPWVADPATPDER